MQPQRTISPVDGRVLVERPLAAESAVAAALERAGQAFASWRTTPVEQRIAVLNRAIDLLVAKREELATEITWQMGRPIAQSAGEIRGLEERARYMLEVAPARLADRPAGPRPGFTRFIRHEPLGLVFVIAPWNYPYLTAVNSIVPALAAGNTVLLKHSAQTPLCAERFQEAFDAAGLPRRRVSASAHEPRGGARIVGSGAAKLVAFTGSVPAGRAVQAAASAALIATNLELGGKDPAYVREDADLDHAVANLVDGACSTRAKAAAGSSGSTSTASFRCVRCGICRERRQVCARRPNGSRDHAWPMVRAAAADFARGQVDEAVAQGARALLDPSALTREQRGSAYMAPQCLVGVSHAMRLMTEESFAPIVGIMPVDDDAEAVRLMNDSAFGLTAVGLDPGRGGGAQDRRPDRDRHLVHEPLRLSRPGPGLGRCQGLRPGLQPVGRGLRLPHPAQELPSADRALMSVT